MKSESYNVRTNEFGDELFDSVVPRTKHYGSTSNFNTAYGESRNFIVGERVLFYRDFNENPNLTLQERRVRAAVVRRESKESEYNKSYLHDAYILRDDNGVEHHIGIYSISRDKDYYSDKNKQAAF